MTCNLSPLAPITVGATVYRDKQRKMKEELASISSFVDSTTGLKQVPVTILAKFVVLFRERVRNNNSQHAYIDKQDFTYLISEQLTPFYDDSAAIASIANQLLDSVLKATHNMDSSTLIENQAAVDIQQFVLVLMLCLEVNSEDQRDREQSMIVTYKANSTPILIVLL